jgi:hypothetical protein
MKDTKLISLTTATKAVDKRLGTRVQILLYHLLPVPIMLTHLLIEEIHVSNRVTCLISIW